MGTGARRDEDSVARFSRSSNFRYNHQRISLHERSAPLAQLDRASGYEPEGREFESLRAHHLYIFDIFASHFPQDAEEARLVRVRNGPVFGAPKSFTRAQTP